MKYNNFLGYHSSNSSALDGLQKSDILDEDRYSELIRDIYIQIISDSDQAAQESDIDAMNEYFEEKGYGFTFVSDEPIKASSYQYTEYKYGDYLYKVYGTGKEIVLDDPNEIGAEIIISKAPLFFKKVETLNENKKMRLFINEDKFNAALSAKRGADQILTFLKGLILRKNFEKSPYIKMFLVNI